MLRFLAAASMMVRLNALQNWLGEELLVLYLREWQLSYNAHKDFRIRAEKSNGPVGRYDRWTRKFGNADSWGCVCSAT
jgi:hypothetical protein